MRIKHMKKNNTSNNKNTSKAFLFRKSFSIKNLSTKVKVITAFILGLVVSGGAVYAATILFNADQVGFDKTGTSLSSTNVQGALDELYARLPNTNTPVKLGDYVSMTPTQTSYTIKTSLTGDELDQTINPSELTLWRVIDIHSDGSFDAVSEYTSSTDVYFKGATGYANFVGALNTIAAQYQKSGYTIGARHMGYGGQTSIIGDTSGFDGSTTTAPGTTTTPDPTSGTGEEYGGGVLGDTLYLKDYQLVNNVYGNVKAYDVSKTSKARSYWIASRKFITRSSVDFNFSGRYIYASDGSLSRYILRNYNYESWSDDYSNCFRVRPILTLKSGLTVSGGSGTKASPYTLN